MYYSRRYGNLFFVTISFHELHFLLDFRDDRQHFCIQLLKTMFHRCRARRSSFEWLFFVLVFRSCFFFLLIVARYLRMYISRSEILGETFFVVAKNLQKRARRSCKRYKNKVERPMRNCSVALKLRRESRGKDARLISRKNKRIPTEHRKAGFSRVLGENSTVREWWCD